MINILAEHPFQVAEVVAVHGDDVVIIEIVLPCHLSSGLALAADAVLSQLAPRRWIDGIADFLCRSGGRSYLKLVAQASFIDEMFHHKLGHWTAADVAVTDEKDLYHVYRLNKRAKLAKILVCRVDKSISNTIAAAS